MKILYIITKSNFGGAQKYVFELAVAAKAVGYEVAVAGGGTGEARAPAGPLATKLEGVAVPFFTIKHFQRDMSFFSDLLAFFEVWRLIIRERPDVLHVTSSKAGGIGALAGRLTLTPRIIFTSHGLTVDEVWRPYWQRILIYFGTWFTLFLAHQSIMISTETFNRARRMPGLSNRITLIKNGIAPITFLERAEARAELAPLLPSTSLWIGGLGELHPNKNWSAAISAVASLSPSVHLLIIGEGEDRASLLLQISKFNLTKRVHLLGYLDGARYLKAFDIFILPSKKEGLPYVLLEAGLAGLPVVASDLPGIRDIIETGQTGLLVEPTPQLLKTSLEMLVRDDGMRRKFGLALSKTIQSNFAAERMYKETFAVYKSNKSRV